VFQITQNHILNYLSELDLSEKDTEEILRYLPTSFVQAIKEHEVEKAFQRLRFFYIAQYVKTDFDGKRRGVLELEFPDSRIVSLLKQHNLIEYKKWKGFKHFKLLVTTNKGTQIG